MLPPSAEAGAERPRRSSAFVETGLLEDQPSPTPVTSKAPRRPRLTVRFRSNASIIQEDDRKELEDEDWEDDNSLEDDDDRFTELDMVSPPAAMAMQEPRASMLHRLSVLAVFVACAIAMTQYSTVLGDPNLSLGATGLPFADAAFVHSPAEKRQSANGVCKRWSQQSAVVNGTLYLYGGRSTTSPDQTSNTWNNDLLRVDLTKSWQISSPAVSGLPQPSGPPAVANGYLWSSYDSFFLYGGEFSDNPQASPSSNSLWEYDIKSGSWKEHSNPQTSDGPNSEKSGQSIQRAAEGAGFSMASLGKGWYFGGHLDFLTTQGWSVQTPRLYLKSFVEYTFPGYAGADGKIAGPDGSWRNITNAGIQSQAGFTQRADGILVYVPGFGAQGILLSLGGGTNDTFTQMNEVDIFDIASSAWYRQATSGSTPNIRVDPCAVVASAADGSSHNIYMFGGQNLIPAGNQTQYNDMWILSVPSFNWISVDMIGQSVPYPRAGHTCNIWDGQMVVVGGYIGTEVGCEQPGVYVFNMSSLQWQNQFNALTQGKSNDPFSQQANQEGTNSSSGLQGSYGYEVPQAVISVIGGQPAGGATITAPVASATSGPLASGKPITYTVTDSHGHIITETASPSAASARSGANVGAIVAGTIAGLLFVAVLYLGFCALVYRKQLRLYKNHVAMTQRAAAGPSGPEKAGFFAPPTGLRGGGRANGHSRDSSWGRSSLDAAAASPALGPRHAQHDSYGGQSGSSGGGSRPGGYHSLGRSSDEGAHSSVEDLIGGMEPTFVGVLLHPRRSLRVVNRD